MKIKMLRKQLGLSQQQLAQLVGVTQSTVSLWEDEKVSPSIKCVRKLMQVFNCSSDELLPV